MQVTYVTYCSVSSLYATTCTFTRARARARLVAGQTVLYVMMLRDTVERTIKETKEEERDAGEAVHMQSQQAGGTGVRRLKQHLYTQLLTLTSSQA